MIFHLHPEKMTRFRGLLSTELRPYTLQLNSTLIIYIGYKK